DFERAIATYGEVEQRFAGSSYAGRARESRGRLEVGGARGLEFERRYRAAWDEAYPVPELEREGQLALARAHRERALVLFGELLEKFRDDPRAKDAALGLADSLLGLGRLEE